MQGKEPVGHRFLSADEDEQESPRTGASAAGTNGRPSEESEETKAFGPDYKDQCRSATPDEEIEDQAHASANMATIPIAMAALIIDDKRQSLPRKKYRKQAGQLVTAVKLNLDFDGFGYRKWGGSQKCKSGDWLVDNDGDVYTVESDYFCDNYRQVSPGRYEKTGIVWAVAANKNCDVKTIEGTTRCMAGDYIVFDREEQGKCYAVRKHQFERMYELVQD